MKKLFFKVIQKDPILTRLETLQNYVKTMFKRNKISEEEKKQLQPIATESGWTHGLPKTNKGYSNFVLF